MTNPATGDREPTPADARAILVAELRSYAESNALKIRPKLLLHRAANVIELLNAPTTRPSSDAIGGELTKASPRNQLVIDAYRAFDALDAIRKWCDAQPYANDAITVSRLRDMLPNNRTEPSPGEDWVYDRGYLKRPEAALPEGRQDGTDAAFLQAENERLKREMHYLEANAQDSVDRLETLNETIHSYSQVISAKQRRIDELEASLTHSTPVEAPTKEHVEAVARAICDASGEAWRKGKYRQGLGPYLDADVLNEHWRHIARAALAAQPLPKQADESK